MIDWLSEVLRNDLAASWAQAFAAVVLVIITAVYVVVTRRMAGHAKRQADEATRQANEAKRQADAVAEGWDRAHQDGLDQQRQLMKRQAIDNARGELTSLISGSVYRLRDAYSTFGSVHDDEDQFAEIASLKSRGLLDSYRERFGRVNEEANADFDLEYLGDFQSVFPFSDELLRRFRDAGQNLGMDWNWSRVHAATAMNRGAAPGEAETLFMVHFMEACLEAMIRLKDLRAQIQRTGYARVFGEFDLDSTDLVGEKTFLATGPQGWVLKAPHPDIFEYRASDPVPRL